MVPLMDISAFTEKKNRIKILKNEDFTQNSVKASKNGSKWRQLVADAQNFPTLFQSPQ